MNESQNLLEKIQYIQKLSSNELELLSKIELIQLIQIMQKAFENFKTCSHWDKIEHKILRGDLSKKKKLLAVYDAFLSKVSLKPNMITPDKLLSENINSLTLKQFIDMQNSKILHQQFKLQQIQVRKLTKNIKSYRSSDSISSTSTKCTFEIKSTTLIDKIKQIIKKPLNTIESCNTINHFSHFFHEEEEFMLMKNRLLRELNKKQTVLTQKYGENVADYIINKRKTWDSEYSKGLAENNQRIKLNFDQIKIQQEICNYFSKRKSNSSFREGKKILEAHTTIEVITLPQHSVQKIKESILYYDDTIEREFIW